MQQTRQHLKRSERDAKSLQARKTDSERLLSAAPMSPMRRGRVVVAGYCDD